MGRFFVDILSGIGALIACAHIGYAWYADVPLGPLLTSFACLSLLATAGSCFIRSVEQP